MNPSHGKALPGPSCADYLQQRNTVVARGVANGPPIFAKSAAGAELVDLDGHRYIDFAGGIGTLNVGHAHPEVVQAIKDQADAFLHTCFNIVMYPGYIDLAHALVKRVPGQADKKAMLQNSGAEAVENAIKIARCATGRPAIVAFSNAFHGRTFMALSLTAKAPVYKSGFGPLASEVYRAPFPGSSDDAFEHFAHMIDSEITPQQVAAIIFEPVQGEGGFHVFPPGFLRQLRAYCSRHGIVLIADEIQSGFCRTGEWFATEHSGIEADLYTLAKSMGGGMPIAAVVGRSELMDAPQVGGLGGTYAGNPLSCAAALATLRIMERDDYPAKARAIGNIIRARFEQWAHRYPIIGEVRGLGAMLAIEIVEDRETRKPAGKLAARIVEHAYQRGLILVKAGAEGNVLRFLGPLNIPLDQLKEGLDILDASIQAVGISTPSEVSA
ncbi:4-aminobutyrate--2-oxoglutarate transaminase [Pusillimonas sp. TS35]|uniref:4-aminobutyrate--2-oxoglutarate transaminase n=1 Tax=Paracandidimonas lactea TaxID=2895524 RepID=UPI00136B3093|nr:4-aminobutyrate--2-oxoglutarate transaminase [Paracandidimonas lactea]MYN13061.1 4-aminobutyrate--2-oxoglutarate transaminase [Pusillimonas sp. TS35]